jgi:hypothetical protein
VKVPFTVDPSSELTFEWVLRHFNKLKEYLNAEGGELYTTNIAVADSPYTVQTWDQVIYADAEGGAIAITLTPGVNLRELYIKNVDSTELNDVTVTTDTTTPDFIDYEVNRAVVPLEDIHIQYNETKANWFIL